MYKLPKENLIAQFSLSDAQAQAIVDMRLRALTGLEREKLQNELDELLSKIAEYKAILSDKKTFTWCYQKGDSSYC